MSGHETISGLIVPADYDSPITQQDFGIHDLSTRQEAVGGYIQPINLHDPEATLYLNEDGKLLGLPLNPRATAVMYLHNHAFIGHDVVVGDALLIGPPDEQGDDQAAPAELVQVLTAPGHRMIEVQQDDAWEDTGWRYDDWFEAYVHAIRRVGAAAVRVTVPGEETA